MQSSVLVCAHLGLEMVWPLLHSLVTTSRIFVFFFCLFFFLCFLMCMCLDVHVLLQMELKLRLMELNWQKSQCVKVITADERTKNEVRVGGLFFFFCWWTLFVGQALIYWIFGSNDNHFYFPWFLHWNVKTEYAHDWHFSSNPSFFILWTALSSSWRNRDSRRR